MSYGIVRCAVQQEILELRRELVLQNARVVKAENALKLQKQEQQRIQEKIDLLELEL